MGNSFTDVPSPWYHQITVGPLIIGFIAAVDEFILRRHIIACIYIYLLMAIFVAFVATQVTPFTALKSYSVLIPGLVVQLSRLGNVKNFESKISLHNKVYEWISKSSLKDDPLSLKSFKSKITERMWLYYLMYGILIMNMLEAISFQSWVMFKAWGDTDANIGSFLNILSGIALLFGIPFPWYHESNVLSMTVDDYSTPAASNTNDNNNNNNSNNSNQVTMSGTMKKRQAFWYIDPESEYTDFCMYLPTGPYYFGFWWIMLYNSWNLHFGIEYFNDGIEIMMLMHLLPCTITAGIGKRFHLWTLSRINNLLLYIVFVIPIRGLWLKTNSGNWPLFGETPFMIAYAGFNCVLSIIYVVCWYYSLHRNTINSPYSVEQKGRTIDGFNY